MGAVDFAVVLSIREKPVKIYLVRHAEAVERTGSLEDGTRWLTAKGRKVIQKAASRLRRKGVRPELIITSPLTRAVQTAELVMVEAGKCTVLVADSQLAPESTPEQLLELIRSLNKADRIMLVGHEPLLSRTAALLLGQKTLAGLAKGSCLCLELPDKTDKPAKFHWYAAPSRKIIRSAKKVLAPAE